MAGYWIADSLGMHALVDTAEDRDLAIGLHGWHAAEEPGPIDQVRVVLGEMNGVLPWAALAEGGDWASTGWKPGPPPELTRGPAPVADRPTKQTKAAAGGKNEEK